MKKANILTWIARIKLMQSRDPEGNKYIINKLKRKIRKYEKGLV